MISLFQEYFYIPDPEIQIPILAAYASLHSCLSNVVPILWIEGAAGSGKSLLLSIYGAVAGVKTQNASWTFASIRNEIENNRADESGEKHYILCLDNLNEETFRNENLYTLFLCGYNRKDSITAIAQLGGENISFDCFSPKVVTTIHGVLSLPRFSEVKRRALRIYTKSIDSVARAEGKHIPQDISIKDLGCKDLSIFNAQFNYLWREENQNLFLKYWRQVSKAKFKCGLARKKMCLDLVACGLVSGVWQSLDLAVEAVNNYWEWMDNKDSDSPLVGVVKHFISQEAEAFENLGIPVELSPKRLKMHVQSAATEGLLDCPPLDKAIFQVMQVLGWHQVTLPSGTRKWRKIQ